MTAVKAGTIGCHFQESYSVDVAWLQQTPLVSREVDGPLGLSVYQPRASRSWEDLPNLRFRPDTRTMIELELEVPFLGASRSGGKSSDGWKSELANSVSMSR